MENKLPITRLNKFFWQDDYDLQIQIGEEYLHGDLNMKLVLYQVDRTTSSTDDVYGETGRDDVKYKPPVEFNPLIHVVTGRNEIIWKRIFKIS